MQEMLSIQNRFVIGWPITLFHSVWNYSLCWFFSASEKAKLFVQMNEFLLLWERNPRRKLCRGKGICSVDDKFRVRELMKKRTHYRNHDLNPFVRDQRTEKSCVTWPKILLPKDKKKYRNQNPNWTVPIPYDG